MPVPFCVSLRSRRCVDRGPSRGQGRNASHWDLGARTCARAGGRRSNPCGRERVPASSGQPYAHPEECRAAVAPAVGGDRASACWGGWSGSDGRDRVRLSTCIARRAPCRQVGRPPGSRMSPASEQARAVVGCWTCLDGLGPPRRRCVACRSGRRGPLGLAPRGVQPTRECASGRRLSGHHLLWSARHQCRGWGCNRSWCLENAHRCWQLARR